VCVCIFKTPEISEVGRFEVCRKNNCSRHGKEEFVHIIVCNTTLLAPLYRLQYCAIYFTHDPLPSSFILAIAIKIFDNIV